MKANFNHNPSSARILTGAISKMLNIPISDIHQRFMFEDERDMMFAVKYPITASEW